MARDLDLIIKELDAGYNPGRQLINQKMAEAPAAFQAQADGLKAQEQDYFDGTILAGARNRGMGFSGIPEGERARYGASTYMPAVAKLKTSQNDYQGSLVSALNDINLDQRKTALGIRSGELDRDEQQRQFDLQLAASERARAGSGSGSIIPTIPGGDGNPPPAPGADTRPPLSTFNTTYPVTKNTGQAPFKTLQQLQKEQQQASNRRNLLINSTPLGLAASRLPVSKAGDILNLGYQDTRNKLKNIFGW